MNRQTKNIQLKNKLERNQRSEADKSQSAGNRRKPTERLTKSSLSLVQNNSTKQTKAVIPKNEDNSKNIQISSAINLTSSAPNKELVNHIPEKKVFSLIDIQRKDFQIDFGRQNKKFDKKGNLIKSASSSRSNFFNSASERIIKNITKNIKYLEDIVANEKDPDRRKKHVIKFLKKLRADAKKRNGSGENPTINNRERLIPVTPELLQSLNLQMSDISLLLEILQHKSEKKNDDDKPPEIKLSSEPFVKLRKLNKTKECSVKKTCDDNISTNLFKMQNTNVIKESDSFIWKLQGHFIDRSLYQKNHKPVTAAPILSTIAEEPESIHSA